MYNSNKITASKRIIAFTLFISQVLTSCINFNIPSKQELTDLEKKVHQQQGELEQTKKVISTKKRDREISSIPLTNGESFNELLTFVENETSTALIVSQKSLADVPSSVIKREPRKLLVEEPILVPSNQRIQKERSVVSPKPSVRVSKHNELSAYRKQTLAKRTRQTEVQTQGVSTSRQIVANPDALESIIEELAFLTFTAQGGHQLNLMFIEGQLIAIVDEQLFIGFSRPTLSLPVYVEPGFDLVRLKNPNKVWQQAHIEVLFPERAANKKGYVYIGRRGGMGGGNKGGKESSSNDKGTSDHSSSRSSTSKSSRSSAHQETTSSSSHTTSTTTSSSSTTSNQHTVGQASDRMLRDLASRHFEAHLPTYHFPQVSTSQPHFSISSTTPKELPSFDASRPYSSCVEAKRQAEASRQNYEWNRSPFSYAMEASESNTTTGSSSTTHTSSSLPPILKEVGGNLTAKEVGNKLTAKDKKNADEFLRQIELESTKDESTKNYSMKVDGRELNPEKYVLNNPRMEENIAKLYKALMEELGHSNFQFQVTGGDRYEGQDGKTYSSTDHSIIEDSGKAPLRGDAVDLRIKLADGSDIIPLKIVQRLVGKYTNFIFDPKAMPDRYPNKHYHLQFPKPKKEDKK